MAPTDAQPERKMSNAYMKAKEKYDAVLNDPARLDWQSRNHRVSVGRHPSTGDCHPTNKIDHPERRRSSVGSIKEKTWLQNLLNRPAY